MATRLGTITGQNVVGRALASAWWRERDRIALGAIVLLGTGLRLWRLDQNGYGLEYYAASVRSMMNSWHNFFYNSFDPAGFVSVDKPPVALWLQVASAKLFGFHGLSVLLPQVLEGVAAVWLVYHLVQRRFGASAGRLAALFLAITPVSVAIDRSSNTDSCLVLVLLLAAWALTRAAEDGSRGLLLLSMALVGVAFNVKMLAAFVVLPTFVLVYFLGAPVGGRRRFVDLTLAALVVAAVSLSWVLAYDLTPPDKRPFAGSSRTNSMLELAVDHNGIQRFIPRWRLFRAARIAPGTGQAATAGAQPGPGAGPRGGWPGLGDRVPVGPLRLFDRHLAGQVGWLLPLAILGSGVGARRVRWRRPLAPAHVALLLWVGWTLTYGIVYSYAGGIFRAYYLATMAPPLAALTGIGVVNLWDGYLRRGWRALLLPGALLLTASWEAYIESSALGWTLDASRSRLMAILSAARDQSGDWRTWLFLALLGGTLVAVAGLLAPPFRGPLGRPARGLAVGALGVGLVALLVTPGAWALSSVLARDSVMRLSADLSLLAPGNDTLGLRPRDRSGAPMTTRKLVGFLTANHQGECYLLATVSAQLAAPIIIQTGEAVMAMGGFMGTDPILSPEKLARMVEDKQVRFVLVPDLSAISQRLGAEAPGRPIADWVRANGTLVNPALWRASVPEADANDPNQASLPGGATTPRRPFGRGFGARVNNSQLYDLRPEVGVVPAPSG
ncbi:MAG: ArnT family glycosyltransferase [Candidatus Methylomirabilales bacterium]